ncbi:hypothetical protein ACGFWI_10110 [Streptomyces sp. NPDC048434]|uniref:hypothetical protein n=1 Tax=Streptomyces sp. NPDC048434 TaxID=3365549 RepID=UPI00371E7E26
MTTIALLVLVLLVLVIALVSGGLAYLAYRHPAAREPLVVGLAAAAALGALVTPIVMR